MNGSGLVVDVLRQSERTAGTPGPDVAVRTVGKAAGQVGKANVRTIVDRLLAGDLDHCRMPTHR